MLVHVKLKNGEDLIGHLESSTDHDIEINSPIAIEIDPQLGFFAKSWLLLSEAKSVRIKSQDIMFYNAASDKAYKYYDEFMHRFSEVPYDSSPTGEIQENDLEDMFVAMMEAKSSIKH